MMGSKVDFQGHPETRAPKTGVVTVSPRRSLSLSPFSRAIGESFLFLSSTLFASGLLMYLAFLQVGQLGLAGFAQSLVERARL